jgi:hypothetical protein
MKLLLLITAIFVVTACAGANPGEMTTQDLWSEYCASDGHTRDSRTGVTVEQWDDEATAAVDLTRFGGHFIVTERRGVHNGKATSNVYAGVPAADGRAGSDRPQVR